jgi:tripartite-type tricarboxylate transporter receptor subunit TctC
MVHMPYRSAAPALADLIRGSVQVMFDPIVRSIDSVRTSKLRPLAVTTSMRSPMLPDVPTVSDVLPDYESSAWFGFAASKGIPVEVVDKLNKEINAALADATVKARLTDLGVTVAAGSPADFGKFIADETEKWGQGCAVREHQSGMTKPVGTFHKLRYEKIGSPADHPRLRRRSCAASRD